MVRVSFTQNIQRHVGCPDVEVDGSTVREAMDAVFAQIPAARGYVLDDRGAVRQHMLIILDGRGVADRANLSDLVSDDSEIHVMQALSGG